jgi:hypothetical protein
MVLQDEARSQRPGGQEGSSQEPTRQLRPSPRATQFESAGQLHQHANWDEFARAISARAVPCASGCDIFWDKAGELANEYCRCCARSTVNDSSSNAFPTHHK